MTETQIGQTSFQSGANCQLINSKTVKINPSETLRNERKAENLLLFSFHFSGLMNTTQPTKESSQTPPGQLNPYQQFQPIQHQPATLSFISKASAVEAGKIKATSTHFELDQQPNCVSSLVSMSCRGRAEAFARSLQSRLRTLGSQVRRRIEIIDWRSF